MANHPNRGNNGDPRQRAPTVAQWEGLLRNVGEAEVLDRIKPRGITRSQLQRWASGEARCHPATWAYILAQCGLLRLPENTGHMLTARRRLVDRGDFGAE
jgi:hypothetical protein